MRKLSGKFHFVLRFCMRKRSETYWWRRYTSSPFVIYWCWHIFVFKMFHNFNIAFDYLLMLTIFHMQNVLIILDWCLCDFLVLKHIDEVDALHFHLSFTDVDIFFVWKILQNFNIAFDYLLMLTIFHVQNGLIIFDRCRYDFLVMKHMSHFTYACKMWCPLNLVLEKSEYLWFY